MTNVKASRYVGAAFTRFFIDDALWTRRKVLNFEGRRRFLSHHDCKEAGEDDDGYSHIFNLVGCRISRSTTLALARILLTVVAYH